MEQALCFCRKKGFKKVFLLTTADQETAIRIYKKYGFVKTMELSREAWGKLGIEERYELEIPHRTEQN